MRDRKRLACSIVLIVLSICLISCAFAACRHRHEYNLITTVNAPTCTTEGIGVYQCACGDTYEGAIDCLGHEYSQSYTVDIPATCLTYGQKSRHCIRCDDKSDIISALGEHYTVSEVPATCTQAGLSSYIDCPYCGLKQEPHVIPALSHDWQEEIISPASCKEEGAMLRTCRRDGCEVSNTIILPKTSHTWDTEHCCTVCGEILAVSDGLSYQEIYLDGDVACYLTSAGNAIDLHIVIPSYYNLLPVIGLADDAFRDMAITAITIPDSTVKIGKRALAGCNKLTKIIYSGTAAQWLSIDKGEAWDSGAGNYIVECLDETLDKYGEPLMWSITYTADPLHCENITYIHRDNLAMGDVSKITALPKLGYKFVCWSDGVNTPTRNDTSDSAGKSVEAIFTYDALAMPIIALDTLDDAPITSKEEYIRCSVDVIGAGQYDFIDASAKIRGRGNSTWTLDKKPYRLKFDAATDLFGNGAARDWTLIANHCDKSLVRNYLTYSLAELFETQKYTTTTQFVEVYLNGVYEGVYAVHEQTQTGAGRVEIDEDFDDNDISFLLELDERAYEEGVEGKDYFKVGGNLYAIKTPDTDLITPAQTSKIRAYLQTAYDMCDRYGTYSYEQLSECVDVLSFAQSYVINELVKSGDIGFSSFYMYKDKGGRLTCGPLWDYDLAMGNVYFASLNNPNALVAAENNIWFKRLLQWEQFRELVSNIIGDKSQQIMSLIDAKLDEVRAMSASFNRNFERWQIWDERVYREPDEILAIKSWEGQLQWLKEWLSKSMRYINTYYNCAKDGSCPA